MHLALDFTLNTRADVIFFFFFQAEDGIRDGTVTGVQTCALPIYVAAGHHHVAADLSFQQQVSGVASNTSIRSEERRVGKSVDLGGRRIIKKKKKSNREWYER